MNKRKYIETILHKFNMQECKSINVPILVGLRLYTEQCPKTQEEEEENMFHVSYANVVGSLMYAMVCTRPYIAHVVGVLSNYKSKLGKEHWIAINRVFRYLCGTIDNVICYQRIFGTHKVLDVHGFVDANWAGDFYDKRSISGYVFNLFGGVISWMSKKYTIVSLSTIEVEYMVATHASKEVILL